MDVHQIIFDVRSGGNKCAASDLIPAVGATLGAIVCVLVAAFGSWGDAIVTAIYFVVYQQVENYLIAPRVMKKAIDLSPAAVIVSTLIGGSLAGFAGALRVVTQRRIHGERSMTRGPRPSTRLFASRGHRSWGQQVWEHHRQRLRCRRTSQGVGADAQSLVCDSSSLANALTATAESPQFPASKTATSARTANRVRTM